MDTLKVKIRGTVPMERRPPYNSVARRFARDSDWDGAGRGLRYNYVKSETETEMGLIARTTRVTTRSIAGRR